MTLESDAIFRKIRSEALASFDINNDDLIDMFLMQRNHPEYVQEVSSPFSVKLFSKEQISLCETQMIGYDLPILYFDGSRSIVTAPNILKNCKHIYLYSGVIHIAETNRKIFPFRWSHLVSS